MCGLAGTIDPSGRVLTESFVGRSFMALANRGPETQKLWREGPATLLHCRLRILDLTPAADQPMEYCRQRRVIAAYNGEIYNYRALREELREKGYSFRTASDTEVLLAGYLEWGTGVFRRARGMWAAAIWEPERERLVLSRDPLGKKPILYSVEGGRVAFASNLSALLPLLNRTPAIDPVAIDCYLGHLVVPGEHSVFSGVHKVPPGSVAQWTPDRGLEVEQYWTIPSAPMRHPKQDEASDQVETLLRQGVRRRLESDVPLGVFLSSGYDSSLVAAIAAQESSQPLVAVTAGTAGSPGDERVAAHAVAERYGLRHQSVEVPALTAAHLPRLIEELGEPFGDPSILPSFEVARAMRREMTVALTGDGGDEGFFGYATFRGVYLAERYRRVVPRALRLALRSATGNATNNWRRRMGALFEYGAEPLWSGFRNRMGFALGDRARLRGPDLQLANGHLAEHIYGDRLRPLAGLPDADALRRMFFGTYLPNDYLVKVDTATMATSMEARCPFLDIDLVEYALSLPADVAFPGGRSKALLRPLARRLLPPGLLDRPKMGFGIPVGDWMRAELAGAIDEFIFRPGTLMASLIDVTTARRFYRAHCNGADHSTRLWSLLALGVWCAVQVERRWPAEDPLPVSAPVTGR
jgi:asparagine synthase (glutamine-hydrolysing)